MAKASFLWEHQPVVSPLQKGISFNNWKPIAIIEALLHGQICSHKWSFWISTPMTLTVTSNSPVAPMRKKVDVFWTAPVDKKGVFRLLMVDWGAFLLGTILARVPWVPTLPTIPSCWTSLSCAGIGGVDKGSLGNVQLLNLWTAVVGSFATVCKQGDIFRVLKRFQHHQYFILQCQL